MKLTQRHIIKKNNSYYKEIDRVCFLSKNLYNASLYVVRQYFFDTKKYLNYYNLCKKFVADRNEDYIALPRKVSQQTLMLLDNNFKSFFSLLKTKDNLKGSVNIPKYLPKDGRYIAIYSEQAISKKELKKGILKVSGLDFRLKTDLQNIKQVRFVPKGNHIVVEIVYDIQEQDKKVCNNRYASIDLGLNNLATLGSNVIKPFIVNGRPLKSINQFYNKRKSELKSILEKRNKKKSSSRTKFLDLKRDNKIKDYLHKSSRYIVNQLVSNDINTLVVGYNKEWKQDINIGSVNNQNFVGIPYLTFLNMLEYKCKLVGIELIKTEESYTSKCSFLDNEPICKHDTYLGKRVKRGLFRTKESKFINADLNASLNILRKVVGDFIYPIEVCSVPSVVTL